MKDPPPQVVITTDAAPEAWKATLQIMKNDKFFNPEKEVKKLTLTEILQSTITKDGRVFYPTNINEVELYRPAGSKRKTKISKGISSSPTEMEPKDEESNLESERINSDSSSSRTFSSTNKESQFHINPNPNRQYLSNVWNQPKDLFPKSLHDNQKNMVFDRPKRNGSESHLYFRKIKYDNGQTESSGNEWRLLSPTKNLSNHSRNSKVLSNRGYVCLKKEPISEEICISDSHKGSGQCRECHKNRLEKVRIPHIITSPNSSDSEDYTEVATEGSKVILIVPKWKGQVWSTLVEEFTMSRITLGDAENILIPGKNMGRRNMFLPPGKLKTRLLMNISNMKQVVSEGAASSIHWGKANQELIVFRIKNP
jgi:hypothetical protein